MKLSDPALLVLWALAAALVVYVFITGGYLIAVLQFAAIYVIFVTGLYIFMGYAGQVSFGHNAFAAISGYTSAVLTANHGWEPIAAGALGLSGALLRAHRGLPDAAPARPLSRDGNARHRPIAYEVAVQWGSVTQGYMGISGISRSVSADGR